MLVYRTIWTPQGVLIFVTNKKNADVRDDSAIICSVHTYVLLLDFYLIRIHKFNNQGNLLILYQYSFKFRQHNVVLKAKPSCKMSPLYTDDKFTPPHKYFVWLYQLLSVELLHICWRRVHVPWIHTYTYIYSTKPGTILLSAVVTSCASSYMQNHLSGQQLSQWNRSKGV